MKIINYHAFVCIYTAGSHQAPASAHSMAWLCTCSEQCITAQQFPTALLCLQFSVFQDKASRHSHSSVVAWPLAPIRVSLVRTTANF